jgi:hypothetical protein
VYWIGFRLASFSLRQNEEKESMITTHKDDNNVFGKKRTKYCSQCRISEADLVVDVDAVSASAACPSSAPSGGGGGSLLLQETNKMLRCSRCRVAHFCSPACQRKHFPVHKKLCKRLAQTMEALESHLQHYSQQLQEVESTTHEQQQQQHEQPWRIENVMLGSPYFVEHRWHTFLENENDDVLGRYVSYQKALGDFTLTMAYSECDTAQRGGAVGLEMALAHYLQLIRVAPFRSTTSSSTSTTSSSSERTEEIVALLLMACDYDEQAYTFIRFCTLEAPETRFDSSVRFLQECRDGPVQQDNKIEVDDPWIYGPMELLQKKYPENRHWIRTSLAFCTVLLLRVMKRLVRLRNDSVATTTTTTTNEARQDDPLSTITATEQEIRDWVQDIDDQYPGFLFHLQNTIPLLPSDRYDVFHPSAPDSCWHLLQDCFFLTPGVNSILSEFSGDDEENW